MTETPPRRRVRGFILEQPAALEATLRSVPAAALRLGRPAARYREVVLVGSGTSKNVLIATAPAFRRAHGCPVAVMGPLEFLRDHPAPAGDAAAAGDAAERLAVIVSQTGVSTTSVAALDAAQSRGLRTVALTAEAESPFGRAARERVVLPIGPEAIGPKTKGYTASLAALLALAEGTAPQRAAAGAVPADAAAYARWFAAALPAWDALGETWAARHHDADHVMLVGAGRHLGTALEASLKLQEMAGMPASAWDLEEALHGRFHGLGPAGLAAFVVGEADDERAALAAAAVLTRLGVPAVVVSSAEAPAAGEDAVVRVGRFPQATPGADLDLVSAIVHFQFFAEHAAHLRGVDPDAMRYPGMSSLLGIKLPSA